MLNFYEYFKYAKLDLHRRYNNTICRYNSSSVSKRYLLCSKIYHIIKRHPFHAYEYSVEVLNQRWPEAEKFIATDDVIWKEYKWYFNLQ
jgi:hypothetical protein